jgi:hypothetical protein
VDRGAGTPRFCRDRVEPVLISADENKVTAFGGIFLRERRSNSAGCSSDKNGLRVLQFISPLCRLSDPVPRFSRLVARDGRGYKWLRRCLAEVKAIH